MWVFELGNDEGIMNYAILYNPNKVVAQSWLAKICTNETRVYRIEKIADIHIPSNSEPLFWFNGRKCSYYTAFDYVAWDSCCFYSRREFCISENDDNYQKVKEKIDKFPSCFKITETLKTTIFGKPYKVFDIKFDGFPIEVENTFREYQISNFRIRYLDNANDRWGLS